MRVKGYSIYIVLIVANLITKLVTPSEVSTNSDGADSINDPVAYSGGDNLQQRRLEEIKAITALQSRAIAEREAREKAASKIQDATVRNLAAAAAREARELSERLLRETAKQEIIALASGGVRESAESFILGADVEKVQITVAEIETTDIDDSRKFELPLKSYRVSDAGDLDSLSAKNARGSADIVVGDIVVDIGNTITESVTLDQALEERISGVRDIVADIGNTITESVTLDQALEERISGVGDIVADIGNTITESVTLDQALEERISGVRDIVADIGNTITESVTLDQALEERTSTVGDIVVDIGNTITESVTLDQALEERTSGVGDIVVDIGNTITESVTLDQALEERTSTVGDIVVDIGNTITESVTLDQALEERTSTVGDIVVDIGNAITESVTLDQALEERTSTVGDIVVDIGNTITESVTLDQALEERTSTVGDIVVDIGNAITESVTLDQALEERISAVGDNVVTPTIEPFSERDVDSVMFERRSQVADDLTSHSAQPIAAEESHEDDVMKEIIEMQQRELDDQIAEGEMIKNDGVAALEAEATAKAAEAMAAAKLAEEEALSMAKKKVADDDWVARSRPGADARPGAKLAQGVGASSSGANKENIIDRSGGEGRDRVPESLRKNSQGKAKGNYFGGPSAADKDAEASRKEAQNRAKETDKMSSGAGDRRREIEAKLTPEMRRQAAADSEARTQLEQMRSDRRVRAAISRRHARPVEKVLNTYNSQSTNLYDVLRVSMGVEDGSLKKAYRALALTVHPDKNAHPDSKIAFDAVQEAFETLSSPVKKETYSNELKKRNGRASLKRVASYIKGECGNLKSRMQLFWVRVFVRGEAGLEFSEIFGNHVAAVGTSLLHTIEHFSLLPTTIDRVRLASEIIYDFRVRAICGAVLVAMISDM